MSKDKVNLLADLWEDSITVGAETAAKVPEDAVMRQIQDGKSHPTWILGHMAFAAGFPVLAIALGKTPGVPVEWVPSFGPDFVGGQPPRSDQSSYPAWSEIIEAYKRSGAAVTSAIRELDDSDLDGGPKGTPPEGLEDRFQHLGSVLKLFLRQQTVSVAIPGRKGCIDCDIAFQKLFKHSNTCLRRQVATL